MRSALEKTKAEKGDREWGVQFVPSTLSSSWHTEGLHMCLRGSSQEFSAFLTGVCPAFEILEAHYVLIVSISTLGVLTKHKDKTPNLE